MPQRTALYQQLPWVGGLNTSLDESMIPANQCTQLDNVIFDTRGSKKKREGITHNWDNGTSTFDSIIGLHDYWFGTGTKTQRLIGVSSSRAVYSYNGGTRTAITVGGLAWSGTLDTASMLTFNDKVFFAVSGASNLIKQYAGSGDLSDVKSAWGMVLAANGRSSSGTTRTLKFDRTFYGQSGDTIIVESASGVNGSKYNGTYVVTGVSTGSVTNDTITYMATDSLADAAASDVALRVQGTAPKASILREHQGRLWTNDKSNPDRIHFSSAGNHEEWIGFGDSGAMDIGVGDGDPEGITAIFPSFKGELFVAKRTKLYRISGFSPENYSITLVSSGIGCVAHASVVSVDQDDIMFVSEKGVHSLRATDAYGDFEAGFASADIQRTFNEDFTRSRLKFVQGAYLNTINSVVFGVTDESTTSYNGKLYLYNVPLKAWFCWPNVACEAVCVAGDADKRRLYLGTNTNRVSKTLNGLNYDVSAAGASTAIRYRIATGQIFLDNNPFTHKAFKRFILYYRPRGRHTLTATIKIDNISLSPENSLQFQQTAGGTPLGTGFVLGSTALGSSFVFGPQVRHVDGVGRGCRLTIEQTGVDEEVEIQGWAIEYEPSGTNSEVY